MPPKRKRQDDANPLPEPPESDPAGARRATRQTPVYPPLLLPAPPHQQQPQLQAPVQTQTRSPSQPLAAPSIPPVQSPVPIPIPPEQAKRGRGRPPIVKSPKQQQQSVPSLQTTLPSSWRVPAGSAAPSLGRGDMASVAAPMKDQARPSDLVAPEITYHVPQAAQPGRASSSLVRPHGPSAQPPPGRPNRIMTAPTVITPVLPPKPPAQPASERPPPRADRNIDKVVFGNLCFRTWYPSYYGKEVLGDLSSSARGGSKDTTSDVGGKSASKKDRDSHPVLERLYVCPSCFKYSKELVAWWGHVRDCESKAFIPGRKVYVHPRGRRKVLIPYDGTKGAGPKKRRGDGGVRYVEQVVQDEGEWSIWEVDGEKDGLFCQNLSLFAKLFLDNKSVFFDVTGFNYFLLVYTPPQPPIPPAQPATDGSIAPPPTAPIQAPRPQVTGFFSKEKMSWDNNNLACILVFPPWQRKGLGALLMGASYEISRREGVLGGPEKPISDLGKKGYKRFWAGEIARWLLTVDAGTGSTDGQEIAVVDVNDCSQATWISPEDCLAVLREMAVAEDIGMGPAKKMKREGEDHDPSQQQHPGQPPHTTQEGDSAEREKSPAVKQVARVRIDRDAVRRYVTQNRISLERACDAAGFVEGYAMKQNQQRMTSEDARHEGGEKETIDGERD